MLLGGLGRCQGGGYGCRWGDEFDKGRMIASPVTAAWCMAKEVLGSKQ